MELLALPLELILDIWDTLATMSEKNALTRTCNYTYDNLNKRLYQYAVTKGRHLGPVERAIRLCGGATLKKMLDAGLDPNDSFWAAEPLLVETAAAGLTENARILIDAGADVNASERYGNSVASSAVFNGHADLLNLLFEKGASINFRVYEEPALLIAIQKGYEDVVEVLLAHKADVNERGSYSANNGTPLAWAAQRSHEGIFRRLIRAGANINFTDWDGKTLLHFAVRGGNEWIVSMLLEEGADPHIADSRGYTPLAWACCAREYSRSPETLKLLLQQNVDVEFKNTYGDSPLGLAAQIGFTEAIPILLENNANPSTKNDHGRTPLHHAVQKGYTDCAFALIEYARQDEAGPGYKQFIDTPDERGRTPLFLATLYAQKDIVELLLYYGSSAKLSATCAGRTPLSIASAQKETEHGAKSESVQHIWNLLQQESSIAIDREKMTSKTEGWEDFEGTCDACDEPISPYDIHYHCNICANNNYDICQECVCGGESCYDRSHTWQKTMIVGNRWKGVSDSLDQDWIVKELANLHV